MHFCQDELAMILPAVVPAWEWFRRVLTCRNVRRFLRQVKP
jgi:hypothetical protein